MLEPSKENKTIARTAAGVFKGAPRVVRYWDEPKESAVDLLISKGSPQEGVTSFATIGLSDSPLQEDGAELGVRVELVGACEAKFENFDNALSTAALCVINSGWEATPGTVFPGVLKLYDCSSTMEHLLLVPPNLWEEEFETLYLDSKTVAWLLVVPISEAEYRYVESEGSEKLEELFEDKQIDVFDLNRASVI